MSVITFVCAGQMNSAITFPSMISLSKGDPTRRTSCPFSNAGNVIAEFQSKPQVIFQRVKSMIL